MNCAYRFQSLLTKTQSGSKPSTPLPLTQCCFVSQTINQCFSQWQTNTDGGGGWGELLMCHFVVEFVGQQNVSLQF